MTEVELGAYIDLIGEASGTKAASSDGSTKRFLSKRKHVK